jgi:AcrR family transcriptional regulator
MQLSYIKKTEKQLRDEPPRRKAVRTKEQLKLGAARVLDKRGYHQARVVDITDAAGLSEAAFYTYFKDKRDITLILLKDVLHFLGDLRHSVFVTSNSPFDAIRRANLFWLKAHRANVGLSRCIIQFADQDPEFAHFWRANNRELFKEAASGLIRRYPKGAIDPDVVLLTVYALGAIQDELTRNICAGDDPAFLALVDRLAPTDEELAEVISVIWHRTLYPQLPITDALTDTAGALALLDGMEIGSPAAQGETESTRRGTAEGRG